MQKQEKGKHRLNRAGTWKPCMSHAKTMQDQALKFAPTDPFRKQHYRLGDYFHGNTILYKTVSEIF
jgi:hypothetical protein